jgi:class 3 adenylate cyclase
MRCSSCGAENSEGLKFCNECGAAFKHRCGTCGFENIPNAKFCGQCATPLAAPAAGPVPTDAQSQAVRITAQADSQAVMEGGRKTVTALFADIKGSMDLMEDLDPEEARAIVDPALKLMIDAVHRYDGYIVQSTGDGIFCAVRRSGCARGSSATRPIRCPADAGGYPPSRRATQRRGQAAAPGPGRGQHGRGGGAVDSHRRGARRVHADWAFHEPCGADASPGADRVDRNHRGHAEAGGGIFPDQGAGADAGQRRQRAGHVYEVAGLGPLRTRLQVAARRGLTRFVGREAELAQMRRALESAREGHGQLVAAMGEPGVGKSRLFFEFKTIAQAECLVLEACSVSRESGVTELARAAQDTIRNFDALQNFRPAQRP